MARSASAARRAEGLVAILLDYGGTLDGDAQHWFDHFVRLWGEADAAVPLATLKDAFYAADAAITRDPEIRGFGLARMIRTHVDLQLRHHGRRDDVLATRLADAFIADTRAAWDRNRPLLRALARRFRLGVVSNSYGNMPALLAEADLAPFDVVVDSAIEGLAKPDPAIYTLAAVRLGVPAAAVLHVGDSWERDVVPSAIVGMRSAWLARPGAATPRTPANVWRLDSLLDLEALLA
ncbi:MAG: HAD family hydrolase [Deltaproteobacteria bacterium]|nr:HAD family hydrolase [Deltaproteobacteria bacterium]